MAEHAEGDAAVEFLVEPFVEGDPGDHVRAAVEAFEADGLSVDIGPFASVAAGPSAELAGAVGRMIESALDAGATSIRIHVGRETDTLGVSSLHGALDGMLRSAQRELGTAPDEWTRADKQAVVRNLDRQGAFLLRGAVDDIAAVMGVSRITIYNYLNAIDES